MGMEKQGHKGGNYVGGFLQLFDWKAKSRKKLFSTKSDIPDQSKQKKRYNGNFPTTRLQMLDDYETAAASSIRGGSDYSYASSVNDEDFHETKTPCVIARLMGLDSLPKSNILELNSTSLFDSQSLCDSYYRTKNLEQFQDPPIMHSGNLGEISIRNETKSKYLNRPIEKFQTEILPPKSAKSIPSTHHKLLSPIKSSNFIPSKDAALIMEAAARIIEGRPQIGNKSKLLPVCSSSTPLKVRDLKEKVQASQKRSKIYEVSQKPSESSSVVKNLKGHSMNKSWSGTMDEPSLKIYPDSEESVKHKGKSISLALQAKANVQKREGFNLNSPKETSEFNSNQPFKSQSVTQKSKLKRSSSQDCSSVLRTNNQKQNGVLDRGKSPSKPNVQGGKVLNGDSSSTRQRNNGKATGTSNISSRKLGSDSKDDKRDVISSSSEKIKRKKRSMDGNYHCENLQMDKNGKGVQSCEFMGRQSSWEQDSGSTGSDVISFTFTSPMTRSGQNSNIFSNKKTLMTPDGMSASRFSFLEHNVKGGDSLSTLLEQKLKELSQTVEFSQQKKGAVLHDMIPGVNALRKPPMLEENRIGNGQCMNNLGMLEERGMQHDNDSKISLAGKFVDYRLPSPVSVLEHSSFAESCNSTDTAESTTAQGGKPCSSNQAREAPYTFNTFLPVEGYPRLSSDSTSITTRGNVAKRRDTILTEEEWELQYVKKIICNIEPMFKNYASGRASEIISSPNLFDKLENQKVYFIFSGCELVPKINRRVLFDCASEILDLRFRQYVSGGYELWAKGLSMVRRKDRLAEEVYKEVSGFSGLGDSMVDELVDKDMSRQYGKWLDFDIETFELGVQIESRILNSLIDEVVADMLVL